MPTTVRACDTHGFFEGAACPDCDEGGRLVVSGDRRRRLSKFASGALRHFPGDAGIELDDAGWTPFADLVAAVESQYDWADRETVAAVVATDPKGRFERRDSAGDTGRDRVRAAYGHSVGVSLDAAEGAVPETLYHGTAPRNVAAIEREGLRPMGRQEVHLSETVEAAREVGRRHADEAVVFAVDVTGLRAAGFDVAERGRGVYATDRVPPQYVDSPG